MRCSPGEKALPQPFPPENTWDFVISHATQGLQHDLGNEPQGPNKPGQVSGWVDQSPCTVDGALFGLRSVQLY